MLRFRGICDSFTYLQSTLRVWMMAADRSATDVVCRVLESVMSFAFRRRGPHMAGLRAIGLVIAVAVHAPAASAETVVVNVDQSRIMRLPDRVSTVVIGNPLIADALLQPSGILVVTGKGFGATNLVALDRTGGTVMSHTIQVVGPGTDDLVVVYRGVNRESYSCTPMCEPRITLGDTPAYFGATIGQTGARNGQAAPASK
jgi:hypothetical protein